MDQRQKVAMVLFDDIFSWEGFGGKYRLAAGQCRLRIFDLQHNKHQNITPLKPLVVVVSDLPDESPKIKTLSVRSCASHIATTVTNRFHIDPHRMVYVEYYPPSTYGDQHQFTIQAKYEAVDFIWHNDMALHPKWRPLSAPLVQVIAELITGTKANNH